MSRQTAAVDVGGLLRTAITLHKAGRLADAEPLYRAVLAAAPEDFDALHLVGVLAHQQGRHSEAVALIGAALAQRPEEAVALANRSAALNALGRFAESLADCDRAIAAKPDHVDAYINRALALKELGRPHDALASCDKALRLEPDSADAYNNRGLALFALQRPMDALVSYERALALDPKNAEACNNRGLTLYELGRLDEAPASFDRAVALRPDFAQAQWNRAQALLLAGDFEEGWRAHEWRLAAHPELRRSFAQPLWLGEQPLAGKTILLHAEQGLGDTIQFCRYAPLVAAQGARVLLEVQKPLVELLRDLPGVASVVARGEPLPDFDLHCPLLSLPLAFGARLDTIPAQTYLRAPAERTSVRDARLGGKRIGLVWSGNAGHRRDRARSIPLYALMPLFDLDATFVSLQKEVRAADAAVLQQSKKIVDVSADLHTFTDTAALIAQLDLVIAVDTSVAHLTGALGKPLWLLLPHAPDWRWLTGRGDSPWYPTARLFRQTETRAWGPVVTRVRTALQEMAGR
jgi:tetratricopeptide (TPR) repeat protein